MRNLDREMRNSFEEANSLIRSARRGVGNADMSSQLALTNLRSKCNDIASSVGGCRNELGRFFDRTAGAVEGGVGVLARGVDHFGRNADKMGDATQTLADGIGGAAKNGVLFKDMVNVKAKMSIFDIFSFIFN